MTNKSLDILKDTPGALEELKSAIDKIPLDDRTPWRIEKHILDKETDEENYVHCLKQMNEKLNALQQNKFSRQMQLLELEILEDKLSKEKDNFELRRLEIKRDKQIYELEYNYKFIEDGIITLNTYYVFFKQLKEKVGELDRESYDKSLPKTWEKRIKREISLRHFDNGTLGHDYVRVLQNMGHDIGKHENGSIGFINAEEKKLLEEKDNE